MNLSKIVLFSLCVFMELSQVLMESLSTTSTSTLTSTTTHFSRSFTGLPDEITVPCQIPTFIKILPIHFRRQLRKIWSGVPSTPNSDCTQQLIETRQLVDSLPIGLKLKIAEFGEENDRFRANFFSELLPEEKAEFGDMLKNMTMNATEKAQLLRNWAASRLSIAAMENLEEYLHTFIERDRKFQEKVSKLSPEAKDAYERIQAIRKEKQFIFSHMSEKAKKELINLFKSACTTPPSKPQIDFDMKAHRDEEESYTPNIAAIISNELFQTGLRDSLEEDLSCFGLMVRAPLRYLLRQRFESLTKSYNSIMQPTPAPFISKSTTMDSATHLLRLLLQRIPYFKP